MCVEDVGGFSVFYCVSPVQPGVVAYHGAVPLHTCSAGVGVFSTIPIPVAV